MEVRGDVLKSLETARNEKLIGAPLEARVRLSADGDLYPLLERYAGELPGLFIVSQVAVEPGTPGAEVGVKVERATVRTTWTPGTSSARLCLGRWWSGWKHPTRTPTGSRPAMVPPPSRCRPIPAGGML